MGDLLFRYSPYIVAMVTALLVLGGATWTEPHMVFQFIEGVHLD